MNGFFYNLGRQLGRRAVPAARKSKWIWDGLTGDEQEALKAEAALGRALATEMLAATEPARDPSAETLVQEQCARLAARLKNQTRKFHCEVIHEEFVDAISLPGGYLFISELLIDLCNREPDELAFLIGHEIGHVVRGHAWNRMLQDTLLRAASTVTAPAGGLGAWIRQQGFVLLRSAHTNDAELEADEFGCRLAAASGFAPEGAIHVLQRLGRLTGKAADAGPYLTSHPPLRERIARLQPLIAQLAQRNRQR